MPTAILLTDAKCAFKSASIRINFEWSKVGLNPELEPNLNSAVCQILFL